MKNVSAQIRTGSPLSSPTGPLLAQAPDPHGFIGTETGLRTFNCAIEASQCSTFARGSTTSVLTQQTSLHHRNAE